MTVKIENSGRYYCYGLDSDKRPTLSEAKLIPKGTKVLFLLGLIALVLLPNPV